MTENTIKLIFARLAKRAGIPRLHIHLLRHTFATRYLLDGGAVLERHRVNETARPINAVLDSNRARRVRPITGYKNRQLGDRH